jgi:hypothetical protein
MIEQNKIQDQSELQRDAVAANLGRIAAETSNVSERLFADALPELRGNAEAITQVMNGKAEFITRADVTGLWHYSSSRIDHFSAEIAERTGGKFGHGVYLGVGNLKGETVDGLRLGGYERHDAHFTGNILAVRRADVMDIASALRSSRGMPVSRMRSSANTAPLSDLAENVHLDGNAIDSVLIYMDEGQQSAELVVLPRSTDNIEIIEYTHPRR